MARAEGVRRVGIMKVGAVKAAAAATTCESTARRIGIQRTPGWLQWPIFLAKKAQKENCRKRVGSREGCEISIAA